MIRCSNRHTPMEVGQHDVASLVDILCADSRGPVVAMTVPANPSSVIVEQVVSPAYVAKIAQAVIRSVVINVVNVFRLFAVDKEPRKPVGEQSASFVVNADVSIGVEGACWSHFAATNGFHPANNSGFGVIAKAFTDRIRNNFRSHAELPLSVVRGLVAPTTSTPTLPYFPDRRGNTAITHKGRSPYNLTTLP